MNKNKKRLTFLMINILIILTVSACNLDIPDENNTAGKKTGNAKIRKIKTRIIHMLMD